MVLAIVLLVIGLVIAAFCFGVDRGVLGMERRAISAAHGHYNKGTGEFKFGMDPATLACKRLNEEKERLLEDERIMEERRSQERYINSLYEQMDELERQLRKAKKKGKK